MNIDPVSHTLIDDQGATLALVNLLNQLQQMGITVWASGVTAARPNDPVVGQVYFDTTLAVPIVCTAVRAGATAAVWHSITIGGVV